MTHYPADVETGVGITLQEAWLDRGARVDVPDFVAETIERVAFLAREDKRIDQRSGVSQRMPITVMENVVSNAERRALTSGLDESVARPSDIYAALPAIAGKMELEYEGELVGADAIARELIASAAAETFATRVGGGGTIEPRLEEVVEYFETGGVLQATDTASAEAMAKGFAAVPGLMEVVADSGLADPRARDGAGRAVAAAELVLEALVANRRISRMEEGGYRRVRAQRRRPGGMEM
jgi:magnesium chelatase subunit I